MFKNSCVFEHRKAKQGRPLVWNAGFFYLGYQQAQRHAILPNVYNVNRAAQCLDVLPGLVDELGVI